MCIWKSQRKKIEENFLRQLKMYFSKGIVKERTQYLLEWYHYKAEHYRFLSYIHIYIGLCIPILVAILNSGMVGVGGILCVEWDAEQIQKITALLAVIMTAITGYFSWIKAEEQWVRARITMEELKREVVRYGTEIGVLSADEKLKYEKNFIEKIEEIARQETSAWKAMRTEKKEEAEN